MSFTIRPIEPDDAPAVVRFCRARWGADIVAGHGCGFHQAKLPGFLAEKHGEWVGMATDEIRDQWCEIVTIDSLKEGRGIGWALVDAVRNVSREAGCLRLWLITTNDNVEALRFCQKRGFELVAVHRGTVVRSRQLKPEIPLTGAHGIPIRDEIELQLRLGRML